MYEGVRGVRVMCGMWEGEVMCGIQKGYALVN